MMPPAVASSTIVVHGFWGGAAHWSQVVLELEKHGWGSKNLRAVELPLTNLGDDYGVLRPLNKPSRVSGWWVTRTAELSSQRPVTTARFKVRRLHVQCSLQARVHCRVGPRQR